MFLFKYNVEINPTQMNAVQLTCHIDYVDPMFEQRILNILKHYSLYIYLAEDNSMLSKLLREEVILSVWLTREYRKERDITEDFRNKVITLQLKYDCNVNKAKQLFEKKINKAFKNEIQYYQDLKSKLR
ncbi:hypothetical protein [Paenibacillus campinasensis]|uniref:Uncharacterized protein n=1 Tax=Paenibacillus campinasensis TaxID=66347 RepID=A0A268EIV8_9BACL|nr:hypothetical protein [Paenibacillus campinasensis]PAD73066.1 hypothetical protein CHH67_21035 [Paenibacillus campinasensis]